MGRALSEERAGSPRRFSEGCWGPANAPATWATAYAPLLPNSGPFQRLRPAPRCGPPGRKFPSHSPDIPTFLSVPPHPAMCSQEPKQKEDGPGGAPKWAEEDLGQDWGVERERNLDGVWALVSTECWLRVGTFQPKLGLPIFPALCMGGFCRIHWATENSGRHQDSRGIKTGPSLTSWERDA